MNVIKETEKLREWQHHLKTLENTKTFHPFPLYSCIHYWKHKIKNKEDEIVKYLSI